MGRSFGEDYLRWSAEWQSPLRGHLLFDHAREPANFVASRGKTTGLSEPGEISSVKHRGRKEKPRGFRHAAFMRVDQTFSVLRGTKSRGWIRLGGGGG